MSIRKTIPWVCVLACLWPGLALSDTWRWKDAAGQVHFGDQPPPGVQAERIGVSSRPSPLTDEDRAQRQQTLHARDAARDAAAKREESRAAREDARAAEETAMSRARCDRARWALAALESGRPVYRDANGAYRVKRPPPQQDVYSGPREYLEEAERQAEIAHYQEEMNTYCAAFPELADPALADEDLRHADACEAAALELEQLLQDEARATEEEIARRRRFLDEECR
ncbi:MAG: DUF4124 domain-containing protein [Gammaproteobacteria bacterium]|nr:DUF4124 domain-containing protein [Gammaproteobacteria bacterium]